MITIIDYGYPDLFEIFENNIYSYQRIKVRLFGKEVELTKDPITINSKPDKIYQIIKVPNVMIGYTNGTDQITVEEYEETNKKLLSVRVWDDDSEDFVFATIEEKNNWRKFTNSWRPVWAEPTTEEKEVPYEVIYKQFVEKEYEEFITSQIMIPNYSQWDKEIKPVQAFCIYTPSFYKMFEIEALKMGFKEVQDSIGSDLSIGKKFTCSNNEYVKCNGKYVKSSVSTDGFKAPYKGTYQDCVVRFKTHQSMIRAFLIAELQLLENISIDKVFAANIMKKLQSLQESFCKVDSTIRTRSYYNSTQKHINDIKDDLTKYLNDLHQ